jgi:hypothetical protein
LNPEFNEIIDLRAGSVELEWYSELEVLSSDMDHHGFIQRTFQHPYDSEQIIATFYLFPIWGFFGVDEDQVELLYSELRAIEAEHSRSPRLAKFRYFKQWNGFIIHSGLSNSDEGFLLHWEGSIRDNFKTTVKQYDRKTKSYVERDNLELLVNDIRDTVHGTQIWCDLNFLANFRKPGALDDWSDAYEALTVFCDTAFTCKVPLSKSLLLDIFSKALPIDKIDSHITFLLLQGRDIDLQ